MNASSHRFVSSGTTRFVAVAVALSLLGPGSVVAAQDAEANLPPSSQSDYHGDVVADSADNLPPSSRDDYHGDVYAGSSLPVAGVQEAPDSADPEANLPPSSRSDYHGEATVTDAEANLPPSSRGDYHGEDGVVAGVQEAPAEIPFDMPHPEP